MLYVFVRRVGIGQKQQHRLRVFKANELAAQTALGKNGFPSTIELRKAWYRCSYYSLFVGSLKQLCTAMIGVG